MFHTSPTPETCVLEGLSDPKCLHVPSVCLPSLDLEPCGTRGARSIDMFLSKGSNLPICGKFVQSVPLISP